MMKEEDFVILCQFSQKGSARANFLLIVTKISLVWVFLPWESKNNWTWRRKRKRRFGPLKSEIWFEHELSHSIPAIRLKSRYWRQDSSQKYLELTEEAIKTDLAERSLNSTLENTKYPGYAFSAAFGKFCHFLSHRAENWLGFQNGNHLRQNT